MGSAFKSGRRLDERYKRVLRDVLRQLRSEPGTAGGAKELREITANDILERLGIALPDPCREAGIVQIRTPRCAARGRARSLNAQPLRSVSGRRRPE